MPNSLSWPLFTIDFEASSLDDGSYPIEVGVALWPSPNETVLVWSTLIQPTWEWKARGHWSRKAERVHGIDREALETGMTPVDAVQYLNRVIGSYTAWCDGGDYDAYWMRRLFDAAAIEPSFRLGEWTELAKALPEEVKACVIPKKLPHAHRAGPDAEQLLIALREGLGVAARPVNSPDTAPSIDRP